MPRGNLMHWYRYEITLLGRAGSVVRAEFGDCQVTTGPGTTTLRADLPEPGELSVLMDRITGLGLMVIGVSLLASSPEEATTPK